MGQKVSTGDEGVRVVVQFRTLLLDEVRIEGGPARLSAMLAEARKTLLQRGVAVHTTPEGEWVGIVDITVVLADETRMPNAAIVAALSADVAAAKAVRLAGSSEEDTILPPRLRLSIRIEGSPKQREMYESAIVEIMRGNESTGLRVIDIKHAPLN